MQVQQISLPSLTLSPHSNQFSTKPSWLKPHSQSYHRNRSRSMLKSSIGGLHRGGSVGVRCEVVAGEEEEENRDDGFYMRRCVELARTAIGRTSPNPMVGCVIVKDGKVVGEGFHPKAGQPHAEIAAYGKDFVRASQETWELFERYKGVVHIVDSDITSSICFLTGVCSGSMCVIVVVAWTAKVHQSFMATISLLAFFIGYLMTRIAMALPHACVGCYYVCYAENPENRLFDSTLKDRLALIDSGRDILAPTPRVPHRFAAR